MLKETSMPSKNRVVLKDKRHAIVQNNNIAKV